MIMKSLRRPSANSATENANAPMPFIIGAPRSGTTLLRFMLDAHSQLAIPPETGFFSRADALVGDGADADAFVHQITHFPEHLPAWSDYGIDSGNLRNELERINPFTAAAGFRAFYRMYARRFGKNRWGDKTPLHSRHLGTIRRILPEARFIHIIRDGRDAALSLREMWFSPGREIETQAKHWRDWVVAAREAGAGHPDYLEVRYEELIADPAAVLQRVCVFIDLPYEKEMLSYHLRVPERLKEHGTRLRIDGNVVVTHEKRLDQARLTTQPPDSSRVLAWKESMTGDERERFEALAGPLLRELGYEVLER